MVDGTNAVQARLRSDVEALCGAGPRPVGTQAHEQARRYLSLRLGELGLDPYAGDAFELPYGERFTNLAAFVGPEPDVPALLIGAHYDTVPSTPGADDNAAAVAITLEVARRIVARPLDRRLVIALFDAEEPPYFQSAYMGSHVFVRDQLRSEVDCALIMDLVGHAIAIPRLGDAVGVMGCESHPRLADVVSRAAGAHLPVATLPNDYMPDMSDHSAFGRAGNPFLFLTWGQWQHYHAPTDVPDVLDYGKMVKIADLVEALLRDLGGGPNLGGAEPHDTSRLDHARLVDLLGEPALKEMGVRGPADVHLALRRLVTAVRWG